MDPLLTKTSKYVQLDLRKEAGDQVVVTPSDENRFLLSRERALEALRAEDKRQRFEIQFMLLLERLGQWMQATTGTQRALLTIRDGILAFVVVKQSELFDESIEFAVSDLEYEIANSPDFDLIEVEGLVLPPVSDEALSGFVDEKLVLQYGVEANAV